MDILDDMRVSKLSAKVFYFFIFFKVNYSFNNTNVTSFNPRESTHWFTCTCRHLVENVPKNDLQIKHSTSNLW